MRILHYHPANDATVNNYIRLLTEQMDPEGENHTATEAHQARTLLLHGNYDLLNLHGCWQNSARGVVKLALSQGARLVVTPHGQLEPWVRSERKWKEKIPKQLLYQRDIISKAYAIITQGRMEEECMQKLRWNSRCVIIRNCLITDTITPREMAAQTLALYRRVMDSNPWELMTDDTRQALLHILKAGNTGDARWLGDEGETDRSCEQNIQWRPLLNYARLEEITPTLERGLRVLNLDPPLMDTDRPDTFLPDGYTAPQSIESVIGMQHANENERLLVTFRHLRKLAARRRLAIRHLVELDRELRSHGCQEQALHDTLDERHLLKFAQRMMQLLNRLTGLTEGFMPVAPLADRATRRLQRQVEERLKI